jgi:DNA polymerase-1
LFASLGFRSLVQEFAPRAAPVDRDDRVVGSLDELGQIVEAAIAAGRLGLAVVETRESSTRAHVVGVALSSAPGAARYVPVGHTGLSDQPNLPEAEVFARLAPILSDPAVAKHGHDLKPVILAAGRHGLAVNGLAVDTMLASYLLDATSASHSIEALALERAGYRATSVEDVQGRGARAVPLDRIPPSSILPVAADRAELPLRIADTLTDALRNEGLESVYRDLELPLVPILADIEQHGVKVDVDALAALGTTMQAELDGLSARIYEMASGEFNINSPKQLSEVLFERLSLQPSKKTGKTRAVSTAREVLEELALVHEMPALVLRWREIQKLKGTYVDALPTLVNPDTGRVHTTFNQAVAATGRLSSSDPNLQNIPIRTPLGREIRAAFIAEPGHVLISADYSQIELRVLAHLSGDAALVAAFREGLDIHDQTAMRVFGGPEGPMRLDPHELRRRAKIINYALLYGKTAFTLAKDIGVPVGAAQEFIDAYFAGFPAVRSFIDRTLEEARRTGVVRTLTGRRRLVPELTSRNGQVRAATERETVNMPIQGTAADILKKAMISVTDRLASYNTSRASAPVRMILTVHDELLFEVPETDADTVGPLVRETMETAFPLDVPLTVDVGVGRNWKAAKP